MKIIKNRTIQILAVGILLIVTIAGLYYFSKPTFADDKISMKNFNEKMEVVNLRIEELEEKIVNLEQEFVTKIENLEQENKELKANVLTLTDELHKETTKIKDIEKNIKTNQTQIIKLNKWYDFNKDLYIVKESAFGQSYFNSTEYIKSELVKYFKQN